MKTAVRLTASSIFGLAALALVLFLPAGTLRYWQAWAFMAAFTGASIIPTSYLARANPAALRRRMRAGPRAETRTVQKVIITGSFVDLFAMMAFSALDHRMGWSVVPVWLCLLGDVLVVAGLGVAMLVIVENSYAAATITVEAGQQVATGGLYRFVRHPMYAGNVIMMVGVPLALGSYWGLLFVIPGIAVLVFRILDEEKLLIQDLPGYREYTQRVRYRLVPHVW
ncbi:methyltransferase family protein [Mycobacterium sp. 050134]|uniref:methyltransferase family protein n=1 Tax=Mycobacterium sp. 050134 TaxID=3096111 RepID=UPI002ED77BD8